MNYCRYHPESDIYVVQKGNRIACLSCPLVSPTVPYEEDKHKPLAALVLEGDNSIDETDFDRASTHLIDRRRRVGVVASPQNYHASGRAEMLGHMADHLRAGHRVPRYAIQRLVEEIQTLGDDPTLL